MPYQLCSTPASVLEALPYLRSSAPLIVDLEAMDLGRQYGALSVLTIGTAAARKIFIFDVLFLGPEGLQPVLELLASTRILKVVWDGRMDDVELRRTFGISFGRILDLQIVDVVSRSKRGAEDQSSMQVPGHPLYPVRHLDTDGVHALTSLKKVLSAHGVPVDRGNPPPRVMDHEEWMTRPLPLEYLEYAANDIELIAEVYALFLKRGYISQKRTRAIEKQSLRYVRMHAGPIPSRDAFRSSNLLPLEVLNPPPADENEAKECGKCGRRLGRNSFTYFLGSVNGARRIKTHNTCKVCYLLGQRAGTGTAKSKTTAKTKPKAGTPGLQISSTYSTVRVELEHKHPGLGFKPPTFLVSIEDDFYDDNDVMSYLPDDPAVRSWYAAKYL